MKLFRKQNQNNKDNICDKSVLIDQIIEKYRIDFDFTELKDSLIEFQHYQAKNKKDIKQLMKEGLEEYFSK